MPAPSQQSPASTAVLSRPAISLADRLAATRNRPSGFDYMRLVLAFGVIAWHSVLISYGDGHHYSFGQRVAAPFATLIVPMFFALSGFLVAGSLERCKTLISFLGLRVFRIIPALAVEVLLSALILGPLLTDLPFRDYVSAPAFHSYFLNILGDIHYVLPGVFANNPVHLVNGQLWTVPYELACYIALTALALTGIARRRGWLLLVMAGFYAAQVANSILRSNPDFKGAGGSTLVMAFIAGLLIYAYRDRIVWSRWLFLPAAALSLVLINLTDGMRFAALPIAYATIYLGLTNPPRNRIVLSGDYSYGLYLYGFPIQQAVAAFDPGLRHWYLNLLIAVPTAIVVATGSWWLVEKPVLSRRQVLKTLEDWCLARFARLTGRRTVAAAPAPTPQARPAPGMAAAPLLTPAEPAAASPSLSTKMASGG